MKTLTKSRSLGHTLRQAPCNQNARDAAECPPSNRELPSVLSLGSTATMPSTHRRRSVALKCRETAENCKCFCPSAPAGRANERHTRFAGGGMCFSPLALAWPPMCSSGSLPASCPPPLPVPTPILMLHPFLPGTNLRPQLVCCLKRPFHGRMFSRCLAIGSPDEDLGRIGKVHFFLPDIGCSYSRKPRASARKIGCLPSRAGALSATGRGPGDRPWVPLPPSCRLSGRRM